MIFFISLILSTVVYDQNAHRLYLSSPEFYISIISARITSSLVVTFQEKYHTVWFLSPSTKPNLLMIA